MGHPGAEVANADGAGCSHCGRLLSRKWVYRFSVEGGSEGVIWYCAGLKSKSQCRDKARRYGAKVWDGETTLAPPAADTRLSDTSSPSSSMSTAVAELTPLGSLIQTALKTNDSAVLSHALMQAHYSGFSVSEAFALTHHQVTPRPLLLPQRLASVFYAVGNCCIAAVRTGSKMLRGCTPEMQRRFGLSPSDFAPDTTIHSLLRKICHPEDTERMTMCMLELVRQQAISSARCNGQLISVEVSCPPCRLRNADTGLYTTYHPQLLLDMRAAGDEFSVLTHWRDASTDSTRTCIGNSCEQSASTPLPIVTEVHGFDSLFRDLLRSSSASEFFRDNEPALFYQGCVRLPELRESGPSIVFSSPERRESEPSPVCSGEEAHVPPGAGPRPTGEPEMDVDELLDLLECEHARHQIFPPGQIFPG